MMRTYSFRAEEDDMERWAELAALDGATMSEWLRDAAKRKEREDSSPDGVTNARRRGKAVRQLVKVLEDMA